MFEFNPDMIQADEGEEGEDALAEFRRERCKLDFQSLHC